MDLEAVVAGGEKFKSQNTMLGSAIHFSSKKTVIKKDVEGITLFEH